MVQQRFTLVVGHLAPGQLWSCLFFVVFMCLFLFHPTVSLHCGIPVSVFFLTYYVCLLVVLPYSICTVPDYTAICAYLLPYDSLVEKTASKNKSWDAIEPNHDDDKA